jgi:hypothetical protein
MLKLLALIFRLLAFKLDPPKLPAVTIENHHLNLGADPAANARAMARAFNAYAGGARVR